ncbi:fucolectin-1-like [Watersipora subatra]|uniref:fucolectin-1-like n=1 Tax=Watersipora subatra TaxID=2589382 RepID=UPI00355BFE6C
MDMNTTILSDAHCFTGSFEQVILPYNSTIAPSSTSPASNKLQCAAQCHLQDDCNGFLYDCAQKLCSFLDCFNPENENKFNEDRTVEAYAKRVDHLLARGKPVTMSTVYHSPGTSTSFPGYFAVDGIYRPPSSNERLSIAHSDLEANPWLRVDLQKVHCIWAVRILNRGDSSDLSVAKRLRDVVITASNTEDELLIESGPKSFCGRFDGILNPHFITITCAHSMKAQFVQLQMMGFGILNIYEFEVHGFASD